MEKQAKILINEDDEHFLRASILLLKGGRLMSKEILNRELQNAGENLDTILKNHDRNLRHKFVNKQNQKLFPSAGGTDVETWDLAMLLTVTLTVFKQSLTDDEKKALKSLKYMRDEVYAHTRSSSLRVDEYDEIREKIKNALTSLSNGLSDSLKDDCTTIIHKCTKEAISPSLKAELTKQLEDTEDLFQAIMDKLRDQNEFLCEMKKEIMDKLNKMSVTEDRCEKIIKVIDTNLTLSGAVNESNDIDFVEGIITTVITKAIKKVGNENDYPRIRSVVDKILKDIEKMPDVEILSAEHKCILLKFRCTTYIGILNLLMYLESRSFLDSLNDLDLALRSTLPNVSSQLRLDVTVTPESMKNLLDELRAKAMEATRYERTIRVPIKVKSAQGIGHIWSLFETGGATERLNELSEAVFDELNTKITVTPSVNLEQVQAAIKEAEESRGAVKGDVYPPGRPHSKLADQAEMSQVAVEDDTGPPKPYQSKSAAKEPDPPTGLQVVNVSQDSVTLKWNAGWDGGHPQKFSIGYTTANRREYKGLDVHQSRDNTTFTVDGLVPGTEYEFFVTARNEIGVSEKSITVKAKTPSNLLNRIKSPSSMIVCSVFLSYILTNMMGGNTNPLPPQMKGLASLEQKVDDIDMTVSIVNQQSLKDKDSFQGALQKNEKKLQYIADKIDKTSEEVSAKAGLDDLNTAKETFHKKVKEMEDNFKSRIENMQRTFGDKLADLTEFTDEFEQTFSSYQQSFEDLEAKTNEKTVAIKNSLDSLSSKVEKEIHEIIAMVKKELERIKKAKEEADDIDIQRIVDRIMPNTFNKEALIMAFMVLIISVFVLALWIYKVQNSITSVGPAPNRDMNAKDVLQRTPRRVPLSNSICIVSFDEARQPAHETLVSSAFLTVGNIQTKYFVVRRHEHLLNMPKCKFYIMCTEFSERHVIIEEPGLGLGDLKRCTYETIQRYGAKMIILYTRDPGSRNLGDQLYNHKIHCVSAQPELSGLRDLGRFFSTYDELSATQKKALNDTVVKCL